MDNIKETTLSDALISPLFQSIREHQPHNKNHLRPCMIIDNPHILREIIEGTQPYFTHPGAEEIFTHRAAEMDAYAERYACLADRIWEKEYMNNDRWMERIKTAEERSFGGKEEEKTTEKRLHG
jgi:hypothetical protein